jgi:hypothetical protein
VIAFRRRATHRFAAHHYTILRSAALCVAPHHAAAPRIARLRNASQHYSTLRRSTLRTANARNRKRVSREPATPSFPRPAMTPAKCRVVQPNRPVTAAVSCVRAAARRCPGSPLRRDRCQVTRRPTRRLVRSSAQRAAVLVFPRARDSFVQSSRASFNERDVPKPNATPQRCRHRKRAPYGKPPTPTPSRHGGSATPFAMPCSGCPTTAGRPRAFATRRRSALMPKSIAPTGASRAT